MNNKNSSSFFQNRSCEYFPCHSCENIDEFNCLFCYCPLYMLGDKCGGNFTITESNIKSCSNCTRCHSPDAQKYIIEKFNEIRSVENEMREKT